MDQIRLMQILKVVTGYVMDTANGDPIDREHCLAMYQELDQAIRQAKTEQRKG